MKNLLIGILFLFLSASSIWAADTLEVFVLRVEFQEEKNDNSLTTGKGIFGSIPMDKNAYKLDPPNQSGKISYWQKHLEFANDFYQTASGKNLVIRSRIFPIYTLKKQIIDYNRTSRMEGEKTAEFDDARSRDYLTFVYDAIAAVASDTSKNSPFNIPLSENPNTKRAYMIAHAGASRLIDGGTMGTRGADTPGDFMDIYISRDAWEYLMPDSIKGDRVRPAFGVNDMGDTVVNGLLIEDSVLDTLRTVMVVSESASQDGMNWGINGIIVNQIGRELGMPNTYDVVKGISRLGYYDLMDFAGYNAGNGFLPSLPAAWERAYMGWSSVKEVRPTAGSPIKVDIAAAGSGLGTEIIKVPLNANEYLLIENRQRSLNKDGLVSVVLGEVSEDSDTTIKTVPIDSLNLVFEDSVCVKSKCSVNKKKASGLIVGLDSYDAGLPASGIVVWKVNDWYLRETLPYGIANLWGGDTLRDHQYGISLVETDGILSIGKTFKNALGEDTYDYGSGTDLLPHVRYASGKKFDTVKSILPTGYANTATLQGGYTGIKISVAIPKNARKERTSNAFMGDSVVNFASSILSVTISIDDGSLENSKFPKSVGLKNAIHGAVFVDYPESEARPDEKAIIFAAEDGTLQMMTALGDTLISADTLILQKNIALKDTQKTVPLYRVGTSYGALLGIASDNKNVYSLHKNYLVKTKFEKGMFPLQEEIKIEKAIAGPFIYDEKLWITTEDGLEVYDIHDEKFALKTKISLEEMNAKHMAFCPTERGSYALISGNAVVDIAKLGDLLNGTYYYERTKLIKLPTRETDISLGCTDIDRDGHVEGFALGNFGSILAINLEDKKLLWTEKSYKRSGETSGISFGDINDDGYPEIIFLGENLVYALDRFGIPLPNFPVVINRGTPVVNFSSEPLIIDVDGNETPEILVPSVDGLVYAYTGKGKRINEMFPLAVGSFEYDSIPSPLSIYALDGISSSKGPELYAFHRDYATAFRLSKSKANFEKSLGWNLPRGGNERAGFFDASILKKVENSEAKNEIAEFFMYPNPIREGKAKARFEILNDAKSAILEIYDITGLCVYKTKMNDLNRGRNEFLPLDLSHLGSDVYTVRLKVNFKNGQSKQKKFRIGITR